MKVNIHAARGNDPLVVSQHTSHETGGTRSSHAHGLVDFAGHPVVPSVVIAQPLAADENGSISAASVFVVDYDEEEVTVRASDSEVDFLLYVG